MKGFWDVTKIQLLWSPKEKGVKGGDTAVNMTNKVVALLELAR